MVVNFSNSFKNKNIVMIQVTSVKAQPIRKRGLVLHLHKNNFESREKFQYNLILTPKKLLETIGSENLRIVTYRFQD